MELQFVVLAGEKERLSYSLGRAPSHLDDSENCGLAAFDLTEERNLHSDKHQRNVLVKPARLTVDKYASHHRQSYKADKKWTPCKI
jgi:hypothetical protein